MASSELNAGGCSRVSFSFFLSAELSWVKCILLLVLCCCTILPHCLLGSEFLSLLGLSIVIIDPSPLQLKEGAVGELSHLYFSDAACQHLKGSDLKVDVSGDAHATILYCSHKTFFAENPSGACYHVLKYPYD